MTARCAGPPLALEHAIRPLFSYLRAIKVPTAVFAATEDWGSARDSASAYTARIERAGSRLAAAIGQREPQAKADPYGSVTRSSTCSEAAELAAPGPSSLTDRGGKPPNDGTAESDFEATTSSAFPENLAHTP